MATHSRILAWRIPWTEALCEPQSMGSQTVRHDWLTNISVSFFSFRCGSDGKESACNVGDPGSIPVSGRPPGEGNGYWLQDSCLENTMDRGAWQAIVHGVTKSQTGLSDQHFHFHTTVYTLVLNSLKEQRTIYCWYFMMKIYNVP